MTVRETQIDGKSKRKRILILVNHDITIYYFRKELIRELLRNNYDVTISSPDGKYIELFIEMGCKFEPIDIDRRGMNIAKDLKILIEYERLVKKINPDVVLSFTIKPNIYGAMICKRHKIPLIANVTGLGDGFENSLIKKTVVTYLYKLSFSQIESIFFQNQENMKTFNRVIGFENKSILLPGSGVNLDEKRLLPNANNDKFKILYFGRIMKSKGIYELLEAITYFDKNEKDIEFEMVGFYDDTELQNHIERMEMPNNLTIYGNQDDMTKFIEESNCVILPSYHEGMSNALLEAASHGRALLATNIPGCKEIVEDGYNGFLFKPKSAEGIVTAISKIFKMRREDVVEMGLKSRIKVESEFSREIVVNEYIEKIERILEQ